MMRVLQNFVKKHREMLIITLVYLLCIMYLLPLRDVGFDDDFAYIKTVENYARTNQLRLLDWPAVTMVLQAIWGQFFYNAFGYSIKSLHFASLSILYFGLVYFYYLLRELGIDAKKSLVATLALLAFPFTLQYSFSFMSDVYYISLSIITIYYYLRS